jgi:hypothetical protein
MAKTPLRVIQNAIAVAALSKIYLDGVAGGGNTYLVESADNVMDFYAGNVKTLSLTATGAAVTGTLSATGVTTVQAGTALLPAIIPTGDPNTGVWFPAADTVAVSTGGTERMRIDTSGNVGIGTASALTIDAANGVADLVVGSGSGSAGVTIYTGTTGVGGLAFADGTTTTDTYMGYLSYQHTSNAMLFYTAATEKMRIDTSGNVTQKAASIASTTFGSANLMVHVTDAVAADIGGSISLGGAYTGTTMGTFGKISGRKSNATDNNANGYLQFSTATNGVGLTEKMRIDSSGNVGIGNNPTASVGELQVTGTVFATSTVRVGATGSTAYSGGIENLSNTSRSIAIEADPTNVGASSLLLFKVDGTEKMRIDSSGNVGIGTTPGFTNLALGMEIQTASASTGLRIERTTTNPSNAELFAGADVVSLNTIGAYPLTFGTTNTERMRIDSSGNVGIGVAPTSGFRVDNFGGYFRQRNNSVINAAASDGINSLMLQSNGSTGECAVIAAGNSFLTFYTSASATPTEKMRIDSSGNVSIATGALTLSNAASTVALGTATGFGSLVNSGGTTGITVYGATHATVPNGISVVTAGSEKMRIDASGVITAYGSYASAQSGAKFSYRAGGNNFEWGHPNTAGYGSNLGCSVGTGQPFIALSCEAGTTNNTFRTRGIAGSIITTDNAGGMLFARVPTASADNQAYVESMRIDSVGQITGGNSAGAQALHLTSTAASVNARIQLTTNQATSSVAFVLSNSHATQNKQCSMYNVGVLGAFQFQVGQTAGAEPTTGTNAFRIQADFVGVQSPTTGLGYGTGAGATTIQATSRVTATPAIPKPTGQITMFTAAGSATPATFRVSNTLIAAPDTVLLTVSSSTNTYIMFVSKIVAYTGFDVTFYSAVGTASDTPVVNFTIIKGATS